MEIKEKIIKVLMAAPHCKPETITLTNALKALQKLYQIELTVLYSSRSYRNEESYTSCCFFTTSVYWQIFCYNLDQSQSYAVLMKFDQRDVKSRSSPIDFKSYTTFSTSYATR